MDIPEKKDERGKIPGPLLLALNLLPGLILGGAFLLLSGVFVRNGLPGYLALLILIPLCLAPLELGIMLFWSAKYAGSRSPFKAIAYNRKGTVADYTGLPLLLYLGVLLVLFVLGPVNRYLAANLTSWLPAWAAQTALVNGLASCPPAQRTIFFGLAALLSGFVAPFVEEVYNRGFLLPRMERWGWVAPVVNAFLFALQHFYFPENVPAVFLAFLPISCVAMLKKDWRIGFIVHCMINLMGLFSLIRLVGGLAGS